jgi:acylphosphatase
MRLFIKVHGRVQGVGYRAYVKRIADSLELKGWVRNSEDGHVEISVEGRANTLNKFVKLIKIDSKNGPSVMHVDVQKCDNRRIKSAAENSFIVL